MNNFGGKANSLIKLKNNDIPVPDFFILSSEFYKDFLNQNNISNIISKHLLNNEFDEIKNKIKNAEFSNTMKD